MKRFVIAILAAAYVLGIALQADAKPPIRPKIKLLFEVGGPFHDNKKLHEMLKEMLEKSGDFQVTISYDRALLTAPAINQYDEVLIYTTGGDATPAIEKGLTDFVESGKALVGIHSATDSFKNSDAYLRLLGARFKTHKSGPFMVKIEDTRHPITCWLDDFEITDEDYTHNYVKDAPLHILARRPKDNEPVAWTQQIGKGRVFYTGLGHGASAWNNPSFQELVVRGLYWAAGRAPKSPVK